MGAYLKTGDIFEIDLGDDSKGYIQYIADDVTQLNSRVIRAFKKRYPKDSEPSTEEIVADDVEFFAHVYGIKEIEKRGEWKKIGKSNNIGDIKQAIFRSSHDSGTITLNSPSHISKNWYIWKIGEETRGVHSNSKLLSQTDYGSVSPASDIAVRMRTGKTEFFHPKYEGEE